MSFSNPADIMRTDGGKEAFLLTVIALAALLLLSLVYKGAAPPAQTESSSPQLAYQQAIQDAKYADSGEICHNLTRMVPENAMLEWDNGRVLLATWTSYAGYGNYTGKEMNLSQEVWVSAGREFRSFCTSIPANANRTLRIEQKMGLPPGSGKTRFVEMLVNPSDIFRPCPDPEINDSECGLDFPAGASADYIAWFKDKNASSYSANGYPWTRLGYTYDWGSADKIGVSEFVIRKGASVLVYNVSSTEQFCGPN